MTLKGLAAKITPQNAHLITQSDEKQRKEARERKEAGVEWKTKVSCSSFI